MTTVEAAYAFITKMSRTATTVCLPPPPPPPSPPPPRAGGAASSASPLILRARHRVRSRSPPPRNGSFVKKRKKKERKKGEKPISLKLEGATGCKALTHLRYEDVTSRHASRLPRHLTFRLPTVLSPRFEIGENDEKLRYAGGWGKKKRKKGKRKKKMRRIIHRLPPFVS